jgi:hypothetical protein
MRRLAFLKSPSIGVDMHSSQSSPSLATRFAAYDTRKVAMTAIKLFSADIVIRGD